MSRCLLFCAVLIWPLLLILPSVRQTLAAPAAPQRKQAR